MIKKPLNIDQILLLDIFLGAFSIIGFVLD